VTGSAGHGPGEGRNYRTRVGQSRSPEPRVRSRRAGRREERLPPEELDALLSGLGRTTFVALDFETTGLSPVLDRVVEIGAVRFRMIEGPGGWACAPEAELSTLVNPGRPIPPAASAVNGITDLDVSGAPAYDLAGLELLAFLGDAVIVAHNAPFDLGFLFEESLRAGFPPPPNAAYDTIVVARTAVPHLPSYSLKALATSFGIVQRDAHRGADDARVCMELFARCTALLARGQDIPG